MPPKVPFVFNALRVSVLLAGLVSGRALAQTKECPVVPQLPPSWEEKVSVDWAKATDTMEADVTIKQWVSNQGGAKLLKTVAQGRLQVLPAGTVHYELTSPSTKGAKENEGGGIPEVSVDYFRRGSIVVIRAAGGPDARISVEDCRPSSEPEASERGGVSARLLAAVGGSGSSAAAKARLIQWTILIADPRRIMPIEAFAEATSYSGSRSDVVTIAIPIPVERRKGLSDVVDVKAASFQLDTTASLRVFAVSLCLHSATNTSDEMKDSFFDSTVRFESFAKVEDATIPADIEKALQSDDARK